MRVFEKFARKLKAFKILKKYISLWLLAVICNVVLEVVQKKVLFVAIASGLLRITVNRGKRTKTEKFLGSFTLRRALSL